MPRLIDADALLQDIEAAKENGGMGAVVAGTLTRYVKRQPTVDPVHAAGACYCRECKHWKHDDDIGWCENPDGVGNYSDPDDFCSYGIPKDGSHD